MTSEKQSSEIDLFKSLSLPSMSFTVGLLVGNYDIDLNQHFKESKLTERYIKVFKDRFSMPLILSVTEAITALGNDEKALEKIKSGTEIISINEKNIWFSHCSECGEELKVTFDGKCLKLFSETNTPCPNPNGMPEFSFEINIPSGKMVFANDLREFYVSREEEKSWNYNIMFNIGLKQTSLAYASRNMGHGFVGNTDPGIYRLSDGNLELGVDGYDENNLDDFEVIDDHNESKVIPHVGEKLGFICTGLWWYSIGDFEELTNKGYNYNNETYDTIVEVAPGKYRITHKFHTLDRDDYSGPKTYVLIEKVKI